jgi:mRNA interferase MazF
MPSIIALEAGDIVLVRFPFTDLSATKQRPALVVHRDGYAARHGDAVVLALSSRPQPDDLAAIARWREAGLPKPTWIKPLIATLAAGMLTRRLGRLESADLPRVERTIRLLIAAQFLSQG